MKVKKSLLASLLMVFSLAGSLFAASGTDAKLNLEDRVYKSSYTNTADTAKAIFSGSGVLYKVIVSTPVASATVLLYDSNGGVAPEQVIGKIDASALRNYTYHLGISSGLAYTTDTAANNVTFLYRAPDNYSVRKASRTATADTTKALFSGRGILRKIIMSEGNAASAKITLFNSNGTGNGVDTLFSLDGTSEVDNEYNIFVSSGLTYTTVGTADWTIIYEKLFP